MKGLAGVGVGFWSLRTLAVGADGPSPDRRQPIA